MQIYRSIIAITATQLALATPARSTPASKDSSSSAGQASAGAKAPTLKPTIKPTALEGESDPLVMKARVLSNQKKDIRAGVNLLMDAARRAPDKLYYRAWISRLYADVFEGAMAIKEADVVLQKKPNDPLSLCAKGKSLWETGKAAEGLECLVKAQKMAPYSPYILSQKARLETTMKLYREAVADLDIIIKIDPTDKVSRSDQALAQMALKDWKGAAANLQFVVDTTTSASAKICGRLGLCYLNLKDYKRAEKALLTGIENQPFMSECYEHLIKVYKETNQPAKAAAIKKKKDEVEKETKW